MQQGQRSAGHCGQERCSREDTRPSPGPSSSPRAPSPSPQPLRAPSLPPPQHSRQHRKAAALCISIPGHSHSGGIPAEQSRHPSIRRGTAPPRHTRPGPAGTRLTSPEPNRRLQPISEPGNAAGERSACSVRLCASTQVWRSPAHSGASGMRMQQGEVTDGDSSCQAPCPALSSPCPSRSGAPPAGLGWEFKAPPTG